jgi:hypothetical protein
LIENTEWKEILKLQPHLINNLEVKYGDEVKNKRFIKLPKLEGIVYSKILTYDLLTSMLAHQMTLSMTEEYS